MKRLSREKKTYRCLTPAPSPQENSEMPAQLQGDWERAAQGKNPKVCAAGGVINYLRPVCPQVTLTVVNATNF